jgi:hypothetical protein
MPCTPGGRPAAPCPSLSCLTSPHHLALAGGIFGIVNYYANLLQVRGALRCAALPSCTRRPAPPTHPLPCPPPPRQVSNAISLWLGIQSPDLFFYAFLPPLLMDAALRLDFYLFKKIWPHMVRTRLVAMSGHPHATRTLPGPARGCSWCRSVDQTDPRSTAPAAALTAPGPPPSLPCPQVLMAYAMVIINALVLTPFILYALGFADRGMDWVHGALVAAMLAPTDAVSVTAILQAGELGGAVLYWGVLCGLGRLVTCTVRTATNRVIT